MKKKESKVSLIARFMHGALPWFIVTILASAAVTLCETLMPQIVSITVDSVIGAKPFTLPDWVIGLIGMENLERLRGRLLLMAIAVIVVAAGNFLFRYLQRVSSAKGSERYVKNMRDALFSHIQKLPFSWHSANRTGDIIQRCTSDVEQVRNFVTGQLIEVFSVVFHIVISLLFMYSMNVKIALAATAFMPVVFFYSMYFHQRIAHRFTEADEAEGVMSTVAQENLTGVRVVRAFGREKYEKDKFEEKNTEFSRLWVKLGYLLSAFWAISDAVSALQIMTVIVMGVSSAVNGGITAGQFIAFVSYNSMLAWRVRYLGRMVSEMSKAGVSLDRLNYILASEEEKDRPETRTTDLSGDIVFDHVSFGYVDGIETIHDVSFQIPGGSTFAVLGGTGSGKSTLMHLLNRLYEVNPGQGRITIGGVDIADLKMADLRENIGMVLQEPFLFSRSIHDNIAIARKDATLDDVREAAQDACLDESVSEFSMGYDTMVGERGVTLSGGQKQRAAIARMLIKKTPIMVFDDSLSAVDTETDAKIREALSAHMSGATVILIAHRVTTLMSADQILVMDDGRVAELGTHEELMAKNGIYRHVYDIQMAGAKEAMDE
ncbi:MAG: ABC transporter ATP-binding protein [Ruminococcaceae bacterium]|nr:ABC transporter ATP-binding protein [Oscillospiraceae bacterium]